MRNTGWIALGIVLLIAIVVFNNSGKTLPEHSANHEFGAGDAIASALYGSAVAVTVTAGNTSETVTHGAGGAPSQVVCSPTADVGSHSWWTPTADYTATTFKLYLDSTDASDLTFDCEAIR